MCSSTPPDLFKPSPGGTHIPFGDCEIPGHGLTAEFFSLITSIPEFVWIGPVYDCFFCLP